MEPDASGEPTAEERLVAAMAPILEAAEQGEATIMGTLLDMAGLGVDTQGEDGDTPLHISCLYGQLACVQECLRRGASAAACDEDGSTPLHDACAGGHYEIAKLLLDQGAPIFVADSDGDTPMHNAANGGHGHVAELLLTRAGEQAAAQMLAAQNSNGARPVDLAEDPTLVTQLTIAAGGGADDADGPSSKRRA